MSEQRFVKSAIVDAMDSIAKLCGCPGWDYPGQVVRDVEDLREMTLLLAEAFENYLKLPLLQLGNDEQENARAVVRKVKAFLEGTSALPIGNIEGP